jgi:hypothetical protein
VNVALRYLGHSSVVRSSSGAQVHLAPNLARDRVAFDAGVKDPIAFREAMSALHAVVVGDFRFKKRDRSAYDEWRKDKKREEEQLRKQFYDRAREQEAAKLPKGGPPPGLEADFQKMVRLYWDARRKWASDLMRSDPELYRHLVPYDPIITVAPDVVFFEGFAKDESSYGCLFVDRDAFEGHQDAELGTTNVDYSLALYDHFQTLRTYRTTRLQVDPQGFAVKVEGHEDYREEKIDLPPTWLRGFGQISAATSLPAQSIELPVEVVYSILAHLKRNREKTGPRSILFKLSPGHPPMVVLEPWKIEIPSRGRRWDGEKPTEIKVWGRRRLFVLERVLPMADKFEVHLLGSGLPSIWVAHIGPMRFVLALSGWTTNDFTSGTNLDLLAGHLTVDPSVVSAVTRTLRQERSATMSGLMQSTSAPRPAVLGALHRLAKHGQAIYDFSAGRYRYRSILDVELGESLLGPEPEELVRGRELFQQKRVKIERDEAVGDARRLLVARVEGTTCETILDGDGVFSRARCPCNHHRQFGLRRGPCRHLLALRLRARDESDAGGFFKRLLH